MKRAFPSYAQRSIRPLVASLAICGFACSGAEEADDAPTFTPPSGSGLGGAATSPTAPPGGGAATPSGVGAGGRSSTGASSEGTGGNIPIGAGGSSSPVGGVAGSAAIGGGAAGPSAGGAASSAAGAAGGGNEPPPVSGAPGRVGAELCPPGPFGAPLPPAPSVQRLFTLDDNGFFNFEGPVWVDDALYFSEISGGNNPPPARINRYVPGSPTFERGVIENSGSNGIAVDADGNLIAATHDVGALTAFQLPDGDREPVGAQTFNGQRFNSPNDLVLRGDGNVYFTDPSFQAPGNPQGATRVYRIAPDGVASVVDGSLGNPNGITLSPDGNTLYVTSQQGLRRYELSADGTPSAGTPVPIDGGLSEPDGVAMDCAGNLYTVEHGPRRIRVIDPDGNQLASFGGAGTFANNVTNLAFGGPNRTTLFITTLTQNGGGVYSVETNIPGLPY
jgi:gluconolactonase